MGNIISSNSNDDSSFDPTKISGCKVWFDATDASTMATTDYLGSVDVPDNFTPTDINGCKTWFDSSDPNSVFATEVGPVQAVSSPLDISGCNFWIDPSDASTIYSSYAGPVSDISSPLDISGCAGWWDASDISSMFQDFAATTPVTSNNDPVAVLRDKSGSNIHALQQTPANRPVYKSDVSNTNGKSALFFQSSNSSFLFSNRPASSTHTILAVMYPTVTLNGAASPISLGIGACLHPGSGSIIWFASSTGNYLLGPYYFDLFPQIVGWTNNNSNVTGYKNTYVAFSGAASQDVSLNSGLNIGRRDASWPVYFDGYICEIVYYNKVLTTSERARVEKYLTSKWGINPIHKQAGQGERVGFIQDKSGSGYHATQVLESNRPYVSSFPQANDKGSVLFNKTQSTRLNVNYPYTSSQNFTMFLAIKPSSLAANDVILGQAGGSCFATALWSGGGTDVRFRTAEGGQYALYTSNVLNPTILCISRSSSTSHSLFRNGILSATFSSVFANTSSVADLLSNIGSTCGGVYPYEGHISEIIVYNRELSIDERGRVEKYMFNKWAFSDPHVNSSPNGSIGCWADKSGNNIHARQLTASYRPSYSGTLNGLRAINFDGTDDHFVLGNLYDQFPSFGEVFIVFEPNNTNTYELYQTNNNYPIYNYAGSSSFGAFVSTRAIPGVIAAPTTGTHITSMRANASSMSVRLDGNLWHSQSGLGFHGGWYHNIGLSNQGTGGVGGIVMNGKIVEVITYNTDIGSENRARVEQYLAKKWGISPKLHDKADDGKKVGYWKSKAPNAYVVKQQNFAKRPILGSINGKNAVEFSVVQNYLAGVANFETSNNFTVFWVGQLLNSSSFAAFRVGGMNYASIFARLATTLEFGGSVGINVGKPNTVGAGFVESIVKTAGAIHNNTFGFRNNITINGSAYGTNSDSNLGTWAPITIGSYWGDTQAIDNTTNLVVGEFLFYNRSLSASERNFIEKYLYEKWNIDRLNSSISSPIDISDCSLWLDASDTKTLFQDATSFTPVSGDGSPVGYWADKVGGQDVVQSVSSARPTYRTSVLNGRPTVYFDGGDDLISRVTRTATGPCTIFVACRADSYSSETHAFAQVVGIVTYGDATGGIGGPGIVYNGVAGANGASGIAYLDGNAVGPTTSSNSNASILGLPRVITAVYTQESTTNSSLYINGFLEKNLTASGLSLSAANRLQIGARTGGGINNRRMVGHIGECIIYNRALSDRERALVENYLSSKWGMGSYSPPNNIGSGIVRHKIKVSNKDAQNWVDRVFENGGTVGQKTADAVNAFCIRVDSTGLRSKFYRLNLFCGNDLNACLTPLYLGPGDGRFYGSRTETNTGITGPNYQERAGLAAPDSAFLLTGVSLHDIGCSESGHMCFYQNQYNIDANPYVPADRTAIGCGVTSISLQGGGSSIAKSYYGGGQSTDTPYFGGLFVSNRESPDSLKIYEQGVLFGSDSNSFSIEAQISRVGIFTGTSGSSAVGSNYSSGSLKGYSFGKSMTQQEIENYTLIMEDFQSSLGRGMSPRASSQFASVTNDDARRWIDAVYLNGGTVSPSAAQAVEDLCNSIDSAGLRSKVYRLNLFCGNDINSCMVPLYKGPSKTGVRYGNGKDTNNNFVSADYSETGIYGGLTGGAGKYLNTGFRPSMFPSLDSNHISVYNTTGAKIDYVRYLIWSADGSNIGWRITTSPGITFFTCGNNGWQNISLSNQDLTGLWIMSRTNSSGFFTRLGAWEGVVNTVASSNAGAANNDFLVLGTTYSNAGNTLGAYSLGAGMTSSEATSFRIILDTFQSALGRNRPSDNPTFSAVTNLDAKMWVDKVYHNGGSVIPSTALAVNTLCEGINSAGLRSKILRLNLFCGDNLSSGLVPVYTGSSYSGAISGCSFDLNNNFTVSDYLTTEGLKGNGSNKYLRTGVKMQSPNYTFLPFYIQQGIHLAVSATSVETSGDKITMLGGVGNTTGNLYQLMSSPRAFTGGNNPNFQPYASSASLPTSESFLVGIRNAGANGIMRLYQGGSETASNETTSTFDGGSNHEFAVFCNWNNGTPNLFSSARIRVYSIGYDLSASDVAAFTNIINNFNSETNRA